MTIKELLNLSPEELISKVEAGDVSDAFIYTLALDTALTNYPVEIAGNYIACISGFTTSDGSSDATVNATLEFNRIGNGAINFTQGLSMTRPFARFFITAAAQAGKSIKFLISMYAPLFQITDNRSNTLQASSLSTIATNTLNTKNEVARAATGFFAADQTVGVAAVKVLDHATIVAGRQQAVVFSDLGNTGIIYIGFDNTVTSALKIVALNPGDSFIIDKYKGDVYAIASVAAQKVSASEW